VLGDRRRAVFRWVGLRAVPAERHRFGILPEELPGVSYSNGSAVASRVHLVTETADGETAQFPRRVFGVFDVPAGALLTTSIADWPTSGTLRWGLDLDGDGTHERSGLARGRLCGYMEDAPPTDQDEDGLPAVQKDLRFLSLRGHVIDTVQPLVELANLEVLRLDGNAIRNIEDLSGIRVLDDGDEGFTVADPDGQWLTNLSPTGAAFEGEHGGFAHVPGRVKVRLADAQTDHVLHRADDVEEVADAGARDIPHLISDAATERR